MRVLSYRDFVFADHGFWAGITDDTGRGAWSVAPNITARYNAYGEYTGFTVSPKNLTLEIGYTGGAWDTPDEAFYWLIGQLQPTNQTQGEIIALMNFLDGDGAPIIVQNTGSIIGPGGPTDDADVDVIAVSFASASPEWKRITSVIETSGTIDNATYGGLTIDVEGAAPVPARVRLTPVALDNQVLEQHFDITNNTTQPWTMKPLKVDCGNQGGFSPAVTTYMTLLLDGKPQPVEFIGWGSVQAYLWLIVPYLPPGETITYRVIMSDDYALESPGFDSATQPAFDWRWESNSATSGSTTTFVKSTATWDNHRWRGGNLTMLTGPNAGLTRSITDSTATTITTAAFPSANASGHIGMVHMSSNSKWVYSYPISQIERNNNQRGFWWINQGQKKPSNFRFDVPGGFIPWLYFANNDQKVQTPYTGVSVGGVDYFAILNAWRTWKSGPAIKSQYLGNADGIKLDTQGCEITSVRMNEITRNPNSMCKFIVGSKALGADEFIEEYVNSDATDVLTQKAVHTVTMTDDTTQIYLGLIPGLDADGNQKDEIGDAWERDSGTATIGDTGTATSATSTTLVDSSKSWANDLYNGYTLIITSGTGAYQERSIIDTSGGNTLTVAAWGTTPDSTSQYSIARRTKIEDSSKNWITDEWIGSTVRVTGGRGKGLAAVATDSDATSITAPFGRLIDSTSQYTVAKKPTQAIARTDDIFEVNIDDSLIGITALSPQRKAYILDRKLYLDRPTATAYPPYQEFYFAYVSTGIHIVLYLGEALVIDGESMSAWIDPTRPEFVATSAVTSLANGANPIVVPTGTEIGDTILAVVRNSNAAVMTPPTGWTAVKLETVGSTTYRVYQGKVESDAGVFNWTYGSAPSSASIFQVAYRNLRTADPDSSNGDQTTAQTSHSAGSVTVHEEDSMVVHILMTSGGVTVTGSPADTTAHAIDTQNFVYDGIIDGPVPTQAYTFTTNVSTNAVIFTLVFAPDAETIPIPPRAMIVMDVSDPNESRLAEKWLELTPGEHTLMLSAVTDGNDYTIEAEYSPAFYG